MKEQVMDFLKKLEENEGLKKRFTEAESNEACETVIKEAGFAFGIAEYRAAVKELLAETGIEQLTDEETDNVTGGLHHDPCDPTYYDTCNPYTHCAPDDVKCHPCAPFTHCPPNNPNANCHPCPPWPK